MEYIVKAVNSAGRAYWLTMKNGEPIIVPAPKHAVHYQTHAGAMRLAARHAAKVKALEETIGAQPLTYYVEEVVPLDNPKPLTWLARNTKGV